MMECSFNDVVKGNLFKEKFFSSGGGAVATERQLAHKCTLKMMFYDKSKVMEDKNIT